MHTPAGAVHQFVLAVFDVIRNHFSERLSEDVERSFQDALSFVKSPNVTIKELEVESLEYGWEAISSIELSSASAYHDCAAQSGLTKGLQEDVRDLVDLRRLASAVDSLHAEQIRTVMCIELKSVLDDVDVILTPTSPITAWRAGSDKFEMQGASESPFAAFWRFSYPFNLTGLPGIFSPLWL